MKKQKSILGIGLLVLVLILGVGYAVVSSVGLDITGNATVKSADLKVAFNGVTTVSSVQKVTASSEDNALSASITVKDLELNETVTATYTIKNSETDLDANVVEKAIENSKKDFFEVTTDAKTAKTITAGETTTVTVTVKLIKTPVSSDDSTADIKVNLTATPVAK